MHGNAPLTVRSPGDHPRSTVIARSFGCSLLAAGTLLLMSCAAPPSKSADAALERAAQAMGATELKTLRYSGDGTGYTFGQAYKPAVAWPKITLHSVTRTHRLRNRHRCATKSCSAAPSRSAAAAIRSSGQQRNEQYRERRASPGTRPARPRRAGPRFVADRVHQLWITPHGVIKAALSATMRRVRAERATARAVVSFSRAGPVQRDRVHRRRRARRAASSRAFPIRCWATRRSSPRTTTTATSAA